MDKTGRFLFYIACIVSIAAYIILLIDQAKQSKNRQIRHEELMSLYAKDKELLTLAMNGIKSGELKVAVITNGGVKFEKEVKQKTKKKK